MELKKLNDEEIEFIYDKHMIKDFPHGELKPIESIRRLVNRKICICYGLYNKEELLAYALLVTSKSFLLMDYYAVCEEFRNKGIGSEFLNLIKENSKNYDGIIVEVKSINFSTNEAEKIERQRRIDFYIRNGMKMTNIISDLFNIKYSIMCSINNDSDDSTIYDSLISIYKEIIPTHYYSKLVNVYMN